jgi:hypothetical protein
VTTSNADCEDDEDCDDGEICDDGDCVSADEGEGEEGEGEEGEGEGAGACVVLTDPACLDDRLLCADGECRQPDFAICGFNDVLLSPSGAILGPADISFFPELDGDCQAGEEAVFFFAEILAGIATAPETLFGGVGATLPTRFVGADTTSDSASVTFCFPAGVLALGDIGFFRIVDDAGDSTNASCGTLVGG